MGQDVMVRAADGHEFGAYVAGEASGRALVVVQEIFGVNHHIRSVCDAFAAQGFRAVAPALFDRAERDVQLAYDQAGMQAGFALMGRVPEAGALADIEAAAGFLGAGPAGIVGYCWGGTLAFLAAVRTGAFGAAVCWYGGGIAAVRSEAPRCPVQMHFGAEDTHIPQSDVAAIRAARPEAEIYVYPGAGHGFGCGERESFEPEAALLAQERTLAFLGRILV